MRKCVLVYLSQLSCKVLEQLYTVYTVYRTGPSCPKAKMDNAMHRINHYSNASLQINRSQIIRYLVATVLNFICWLFIKKTTQDTGYRQECCQILPIIHPNLVNVCAFPRTYNENLHHTTNLVPRLSLICLTCGSREAEEREPGNKVVIGKDTKK